MIFSTDAGLFPAASCDISAPCGAPVIKPGFARWWAMRGFEPAARRRGADAPGAFLAPPNRRFSQALQSPLLPIAHDPRHTARRGLLPAAPSLIYGVGGRRLLRFAACLNIQQKRTVHDGPWLPGQGSIPVSPQHLTQCAPGVPLAQIRGVAPRTADSLVRRMAASSA